MQDWKGRDLIRGTNRIIDSFDCFLPQCEHGATKHQNRRTNYFGMARCPILFGIADDAVKSITAVKTISLISQIIDKKQTKRNKQNKAKQRNAKTEAKRNRQAKEQTREEEYPSSKRLKR